MAKRKHYTKEFKLQAANLVVREGYSQSEAARRLGVSTGSITTWIAQFRSSGELAENEKTTSESDELKKLRKENRRLNLEVEILKKAAAYFAKESM
jgi:transposase-like protein